MLHSCWKRPKRSICVCDLVAVILVGILHTLKYTQKTSIKMLSNEEHTLAEYGDLRFGIVDNFTGKIPSDAELASMTATQLEDLYWSYINTIQILCQKILRVGNIDDGGKEVCTDEPFRPGPPCPLIWHEISYRWRPVSMVEYEPGRTPEKTTDPRETTGKLSHLPTLAEPETRTQADSCEMSVIRNGERFRPLGHSGPPRRM